MEIEKTRNVFAMCALADVTQHSQRMKNTRGHMLMLYYMLFIYLDYVK